MRIRRRARSIVLQALYELDFTTHTVENVFHARLDDWSLPQSAADFAWTLVRGVQTYRTYLDGVVEELAPEWPLAQIAAVDRNVLRLAVYELLFMPETPPKVVINEAVELAKAFGADSSARFVNGVLGSLVTGDRVIISVKQTIPVLA